MRVFLLISLLLAGCAASNPSPQTPTSETSQDPPKGRVRAEIEEALKNIDAELKQLDERIQKAVEEGKTEAAEANKKLSKDLHETREQLRKDLEKVGNEADEASKTIDEKLKALRERIKQAL